MTDITPALADAERVVEAANVRVQAARVEIIQQLREKLPRWIDDCGKQIALEESEHTQERGVQRFKDALDKFAHQASVELSGLAPARLDPTVVYKDRTFTSGGLSHVLGRQVGWLVDQLAEVARSEGYQVRSPEHGSIRVGTKYLGLPKVDYAEWLAAENAHRAATHAHSALNREHLQSQVGDMWG